MRDRGVLINQRFVKGFGTALQTQGEVAALYLTTNGGRGFFFPLRGER